MAERKMATIRIISKIQPIDGADNIELAHVDGWKVIVKKGEYCENDKVIYCEIDSFLPMTPTFEFLRPRGIKKNENGEEGHVLKTVKLRGCISQGLIVPASIWNPDHFGIGDDVSDLLSIKKYEPPMPTNVNGIAKGLFPSFIRKTDEERIQNVTEILQTNSGKLFYITEKLDGSSFTAYLKDGEFGVCSRNLELKESDSNTLWKIARNLKLEENLRALGKNIAIQGELVGDGIQKNRYKIKGQKIFFFTVFDIDNYCPLPYLNFMEILESLKVECVPLISDFILNHNIDQILNLADGNSKLHETPREGLVFRDINDSSISFKCISNKFLLKNSDD